MKFNISRNASAEKKKKPFFLRWWFILIVIVIICITALSTGGNKEKVKWNDMVLGEMLPEPSANKGDIWENSDECLDVDLIKVSAKEYSEYVKECKDFGYTIDAEKTADSYSAYNEDGYKLELGYFDYNEELSIKLEMPVEMKSIKWPDSPAGNQLPEPESKIGKFSYEYDDNFFVYIGETDEEAYNEYVNACSEKGFNIDYEKGETYYLFKRLENADLILSEIG